MNRPLWEQVMALRSMDNRHKGVANTLNRDDINTILATLDYFGASVTELQQVYFDLSIARYRVFDWLAMGIMSAGDNPRIPLTGLKVLVYSFISCGGYVTGFIDDLRSTDYDLDNRYMSINLMENVEVLNDKAKN